MFSKTIRILKNILTSIKKEIVFVFLVFILVLVSLLLDNQIIEPQHVWQVKKSVKGEHTYRANKLDHLKEIEITTKKTPKVIVVEKINPPKTNISDQPKLEGLSPQSLVAALSAYRAKKGLSGLAADPSLSGFAQNRASYFSSRGSMDSHAGFQDFVNNQDGFKRLGFLALGENSSFGYSLSPTDLIEKAFASHAPHEANQLNPDWTHVGVGVSGQAVDIVFGGKKL